MNAARALLWAEKPNNFHVLTDTSLGYEPGSRGALAESESVGNGLERRVREGVRGKKRV